MIDIKAAKYTDYYKDHNNSGGPGGLELAEFLAEKMSIQPDRKLIDIGFFRGYQTCFLAKEYGVDIVAIDPGGELFGIPYGIEPLMENARAYGVENRILGIKTGVPDTLLPCNYFDYAYTTTCLEMLRESQGAEGYAAALKEVRRILKKGGTLGLAEPMRRAVPISDEAAAYAKEYNFDKCFVTDEEVKSAVIEAGFTVLESGYCKDADKWWLDHVRFDDPDAQYTKAIRSLVPSGWLSFGYVIAIK